MAKCKEILRELEHNGWYVAWHGKGSHVILKHDTIKGFIVFPNHGSAEMAIGTLKQIKKVAGLK